MESLPRPVVSPEQLPVGRAIAGPAEAAGIDEGFRKVNRMTIELFPVLRQRTRDAPQDVRGQMRNLNPGQYQESRVVSNEADVAPSGFRRPADMAIAAAQMTRR